jgi:hypothetical protein
MSSSVRPDFNSTLRDPAILVTSGTGSQKPDSRCGYSSEAIKGGATDIDGGGLKPQDSGTLGNSFLEIYCTSLSIIQMKNVGTYLLKYKVSIVKNRGG